MNRLAVSLKHLSQKLTKPHHLSKPFHTLSKPNPTISNPKLHGFFSNPVLAKHFMSTTLPKGPTKGSSLGPTAGFVRTYIPSPWASTQRGGWRSWSHGYSADNVVLGLIVANAGVFILWRVLDRDFMHKNFTISLDNFKSGRIHTLVTNAFSHIEMGHIASNMIGLYFFGSSIGRSFGPEYLLKLYVAGAVVGSVFYLVHHAFLAHMFKKQGTFYRDPSKVPALGASGAVNAIMLLDIFLFPRATIMMDFFIPVPAILLGIFLIGKDVLRILEGDNQISGSAHLGGATVAAAALLQLKRGRGFRF